MSKQGEHFDSGTSTKVNSKFEAFATDSTPLVTQSTTSLQSELVLGARKPYRTIIRGMKIDDQDNPS